MCAGRKSLGDAQINHQQSLNDPLGNDTFGSDQVREMVRRVGRMASVAELDRGAGS